MNLDSGAIGCNSQLDAGHNFELVRIEDDRGRYPVVIVLGADAELIRNAWCHTVKLEHPLLSCQDRTRVIAFNFFKDDRCVRDHIAVDVSDGAHDGCRPGSLWADLA